MSTQWLRLWHDIPNDPKWRTIAKASSQRIGDVMAVYMHLLVCASNATERGRTQLFSHEDVASALDIETEQVTAIINAMQGRVLNDDWVSGWEKRQVAREDGAAERSKQWRLLQKEAKTTEKNATERNRTQAERKRTQDTDKEEKKEKAPRKRVAPTLAPDRPHDVEPQVWDDWCELRRKKRSTVSVTAIDGARTEAAKAGITLNEFLRIWCRRGSQGLEAAWLKPDELASNGGGVSQASRHVSFADQAKARMDALTGRTPVQPKIKHMGDIFDVADKLGH